MPVANPLIRPIRSPFGEEMVYAVPPLRPDVAIIHAQRADTAGDTRIWGLIGLPEGGRLRRRPCHRGRRGAGRRVGHPGATDRTVIPGLIVDAVVVEPFGAHPSYAQGYYDRDNRHYVDWDAVSRDPDILDTWLRDHVLGVPDRAAYMELLGAEARARIQPSGSAPSGEVDYGRYA